MCGYKMGKSVIFLLAFMGILLLDPYVPEGSDLRVENDWYEGLQYLILIVGFWLACKDAGKGNPKIVRVMGWAAAPAWLVVLAREINWGRIYFDYSRIYKYWAVYPLVTCLLLFSAYFIFRYHILRDVFRMIRKGYLPLGECFSLLLFVVGHYMGEKVLDSSFIEVTMEFFCYLNLLWLVIQVRRIYRSHPEEFGH